MSARQQDKNEGSVTVVAKKTFWNSLVYLLVISLEVEGCACQDIHLVYNL